MKKKNVLSAFFGYFRTMHSFKQKTKKWDLGEIYFVLNFQGSARCATGEAGKKRNKKMKKLPKNMLVYTFI